MAKTRLGLIAVPWRPYAAFVAKAAAVVHVAMYPGSAVVARFDDVGSVSVARADDVGSVSVARADGVGSVSTSRTTS